MALFIFIFTILLMMISLIFFPKIKIKNKYFNTYWMIILLGSLLSIIILKIDFKELKNSIFSSNEMNPIKLITLFISMSILSLYLDEIGFFKSLSLKILNKVKLNQILIFTIFCLLISLLTIFVSNDVIILTLTPLAIYFCKNALINPLPYVFSVLVFSNTFSMILIIGNPTNIYLATNQNINFIDYFKTMSIPGLLVGIISYLSLIFVFRKELKEKVVKQNIIVPPLKKFELRVGLTHLVIFLILLIISNIINIPMYLITLIVSFSLIIITSIYYLYTKQDNKVFKAIKKAPFSFIPLILGMYILIEGLKTTNLDLFTNFLNKYNNIYSYGISSFLLSNIMNNLPMSMFYSSFIPLNNLQATYATILGSNLGVLLTPFGALAGLMWMELLRNNNIKINYLEYTKKLILTAILTLFVGLLSLKFIL